jgi:hypothetical protein
MISSFTGACDPNHTILAFDCHAILAVVEIQYLTRLKEQFDLGGF